MADRSPPPVTAPPVDVGAVLDARRVNELRGLGNGDGSFLTEVVAAFLREVPEEIGSLERAVAGGDGSGAARDAHRLKGQAASLGAPEMVEPCARLERQARAGDLEGAAELVAEIQRQFQRAAAAFRLLVAPS
jgi:HPt (histidine-containing phosphotransfer) domain-containing protein